MDWISEFFGRLHPLVVHFPIGVLFVAFFFECLSHLRSYRKLRAAVRPALLVGVLCAILSVVTGLYLSEEGGYDDELLERHKSLGIVTAALGVIVYVFGALSRKYFQEKIHRRRFQFVLFIPLIILVSLTGHYGGSMTHGEDYLFAATSTGKELVDPAEKLQTISDVDNATLYAHIIQPILESRCYSCHSSRKQKGDLRLDGIDFIRRGGETGPIIDPGVPDSSSLFVRLMLPLEHDDHMPPNEKPQPSSAEIALIQSWIRGGADFEMRVSASPDHAKIKTYFASLIDQSEKEMVIPQDEVSAPDEKTVAQLKTRGVIVLPVGRESNYLSISFVNKRSVSADDIALLLPLKAQIIWLDLARTTITDEHLKTIGQLLSLRRLNVQNTAISDLGIMALAPLPELQYLNLVGTNISDKGLKDLSDVKSLRKIYVYQTVVTHSGIDELLTALPEIQVDTGGYELPSLLTDSVIIEFDPS
jgi:uncharacterized membrane protein